MSLRSRLDDLPIYEVRDSQVAAIHFNLVLIALKRLEKSIRFELPHLRTLDLILEEDAWVVVDRAQNDIPILAWVNFSTQQRSNLHEPISCQRRSYHAHALIIIDKVMEAMQLILGEQLSARIGVAEHASITSIKNPA
jgi:hypothetical protein